MGKSIIECFLLVPSDQGEEFLRRIVFSDECDTPCTGAKSYHDHTEIITNPVPYPDSDSNGTYIEGFPDDDPRWPTHCSCGYEFKPEAERQAYVRRLFRRSDTGGLTSLEACPPGGMWFADWYPDDWKGPDGHTLVVRTPAGDWVVDGPKNKRWQRSGVAPNITATPSILVGGPDGKSHAYHGWLTNGKLIEV